MNDSLGIYYRREAYQETTRRRAPATSGNLPSGLMGREVASQGFMDALLEHGNWQELQVVLESAQDRAPLVEHCSHRLKDKNERKHIHLAFCNELTSWMQHPKANVVHFPYPPDERFCWARQATNATVALSGVTHTLCSQAGIEALWRMLVGPWQHFDRLVCTSQAVLRMVRDTTQAMQEHLRDNSGTTPTWKPGLEVIPLGVDVRSRQPATSTRRHEARRRLGIGNERLVILFVGRLSHHAKSQPYPLFVAAQRAAERLGTEVFLVQCGWFSHNAVRNAYEKTARRVAPNVRLITVDGLDPWWRTHVWDSADIFVSLADSIQETFGLTNIEAMAHGLPVIASDWNGYRDTVVHGETGLLVPTYMVRGANDHLTTRLITRELSYDHFLAASTQTIAVSISDTCEAMVRLATEPELRASMGRAGRMRAERLYAWPHIIRQYETMWQAQRDELRASQAKPALRFDVGQAHAVANEHQRSIESSAQSDQPVPPLLSAALTAAPAIYPSIDVCFASYPTHWLDASTYFQRITSPSEELATAVADPLINHTLSNHISSAALIDVFNKLEKRFGLIDLNRHLDENLSKTIDPTDESLKNSSSTLPSEPNSSATIAWLLKYGYIEPIDRTDQPLVPTEPPWMTFVTTCMGRLEDLQSTLPLLVSQSGAAVVVVDYSCPQEAGKWVSAHYPQVTLVSITGKTLFDRSDAKNSGVWAARTPWVCLIDCDIQVTPQFVTQLRKLAKPGCIVRSDAVQEGTGGTFLFEKSLFEAVEGHDHLFVGWGEQDEDLVDALKFAGARPVFFPAAYLDHRDHDDDARTRFHQQSNRRASQLINRVYRCAKWDWARVMGCAMNPQQRRDLRTNVERQLKDFLASGEATRDIEVAMGTGKWPALKVGTDRRLVYRVHALDTPNRDTSDNDHQ